MTTKAKRTYRCALCGRRLKAWIYSRSTGARYCLEGHGCQRRKR